MTCTVYVYVDYSCYSTDLKDKVEIWEAIFEYMTGSSTL